MSESVGLVKYDAMCKAIAACHGVDEVCELRNKAKALELYAKQAQNIEAERKAGEIRLRAEERAGALLKEMKDNGQRAKVSDGASSRTGRLDKPALSDLGITRDQSSKWQQLADIPKEEFEAILAAPGTRPSTNSILASRGPQGQKMHLDPKAVTVHGIIRRLTDEFLSESPEGLFQLMPDFQQEYVRKALPDIIAWLKELK